MDKNREILAAFFGMLDRWNRARGGVSVNNSKTPIELLEQSRRCRRETTERDEPFEDPHL